MCFTFPGLTRKSKTGLNNLGLMAKLNTKGGNQLASFGSETIQHSGSDKKSNYSVFNVSVFCEEPDILKSVKKA